MAAGLQGGRHRAAHLRRLLRQCQGYRHRAQRARTQPTKLSPPNCHGGCRSLSRYRYRARARAHTHTHTHAHKHEYTNSRTHALTHSRTHSNAHLPAHSLAHPPIQSPTHQRILSHTHSLTQSLTRRWMEPPPRGGNVNHQELFMLFRITHGKPSAAEITTCTSQRKGVGCRAGLIAGVVGRDVMMWSTSGSSSLVTDQPLQGAWVSQRMLGTASHSCSVYRHRGCQTA